jgi:hypothetical protein
MKDGVIQSITLTTDDLGEFADTMLKDKAIIENVLDLEIRIDLRNKPMRQLNEVLKLIGLRCEQVTKKKTKPRMIYVYQLDPDSYGRMLGLVEKRRDTDGWRTLYEIHGWDAKELEDEDEDELADWLDTIRRPKREKAAV